MGGGGGVETWQSSYLTKSRSDAAFFSAHILSILITINTLLHQHILSVSYRTKTTYNNNKDWSKRYSTV